MLKKQLSKCALLLDSARCHSTKRFTDKLNELQVKKVQIPPRMTNLLQPADVSWFKPLKSHYHRLWTEWFLEGNHTYTRSDNARSPGYSKAIEWLSLMWSSLQTHIIINSFECCGVVNQYKLHKALNHIVTTKNLITDYIETAVPSDEVDGFESDDEIFDDLNEPHITVLASHEIDSEIIPSYQIATNSAQHNNTQPENSLEYDVNNNNNDINYNKNNNIEFVNEPQYNPQFQMQNNQQFFNQQCNTQYNPPYNPQLQFQQQYNTQYHPPCNPQFNQLQYNPPNNPPFNHPNNPPFNPPNNPPFNPPNNPQYNLPNNPLYNHPNNPSYNPPYNHPNNPSCNPPSQYNANFSHL